MSRIWNICLLVLVAAGLTVAGCDKKGAGDKETKEQKSEKSEADEPKEAQKEEEAEETEEEEEAEFSQEDYVQASAELSCIDSKLGEDQIEDREKVDENVLGKYGFDEDSYAKAEEKFAENEEANKAIETKLEECDEETAKKFAGLTDSEGEEGDKEEKAKPAPKPNFTGTLSGTKENASGFERAELKVTVRNDFSASGKFSGRREGKGFRISLNGEVTKDNQLKLSGADGKNKVDVSGPLKSKHALADVSGSVWEKKFSTALKLE